MSNKDIVVFTHNDLDALGCMLHIHQKFPDIHKHFFHTNYQNIGEITDQILDLIKLKSIALVIIADVSFSDNKKHLRKLLSAAKCVLIDHHLYPDDFWNDLDGLSIRWSNEKCAASLCGEFFRTKGQNSNLDKLTKIIDVYDIWRTEHKAFNLAQDLNNYFWATNIRDFYDYLVKNDCKLPQNFANVTKNIRNEQSEALKRFENTGSIRRANVGNVGGVTVAFVNEHFNPIIINEMANGQNFVILINHYGIVRVRVNKKCNVSSENLEKLRETLMGNSNICHAYAFTYKIGGSGRVSLGELATEAERVVQALEAL